jgi:threonine dehydratase
VTAAGPLDLPDIEAIRAAHRRIAPFAVRTPVLHSAALDELVGTELHLKCESMQRGGSFKLRGATNAVRSLRDDQAAAGVAAHSSGNHATALALAAAARGIPAYLVMPTDAPAAKRDAVRAAGGTVVDCAPTLAARVETLARVLADTGAHEVHPYDDPRVIAGAGTAAVELLEEVPDLDLLIAPVSGGGLLSGTAIASAALAPGCRVWGAEPAGADDAHRSLGTGERVTGTTPDTIADGLRAELSDRTFAALRTYDVGIVTVTDEQIIDAMRVLFTVAKLVVESSGATGLAGVRALSHPLPARVGVIVSGGNLDLGRLPFVG